jgi:hypothetical protein
MRGRSAGRIVVLLAVLSIVGMNHLVVAHPAQDRPQAIRNLDVVERELLGLMHGPSVPVKASHALCDPGGAPPAGDDALKHWLWGDTGCELRFDPRPDSLVSPFSEGGAKQLHDSPVLRDHLNALLDEVSNLVKAEPIPVERRLLLHSTAWELAFGLQTVLEGHHEWQEAVGPTVRRALELLRATRFSNSDIALLPSSLTSLAEGSGLARIAPVVAALTSHDPGFVEVVPPSDLHAEILLGRFSARIFLSSTIAAEREELRRFVTDPAVTYRELDKLPQRFSGLEGILLLYLNVFDMDGRVRPTSVVGLWQSYYFTEKTSFDLAFADAEHRISFLVIEALRQWGGGSPLRYSEAGQPRMSRRGFLDVKPWGKGASVTTLRAHCLKCHLNVVGTFNTHVPRPVEFVAPLVRPADSVLSWFYAGFERDLAKWERQYGLSANGGDGSPATKADRGERPTGADGRERE